MLTLLLVPLPRDVDFRSVSTFICLEFLRFPFS